MGCAGSKSGDAEAAQNFFNPSKTQSFGIEAAPQNSASSAAAAATSTSVNSAGGTVKPTSATPPISSTSKTDPMTPFSSSTSSSNPAAAATSTPRPNETATTTTTKTITNIPTGSSNAAPPVTAAAAARTGGTATTSQPNSQQQQPPRENNGFSKSSTLPVYGQPPQPQPLHRRTVSHPGQGQQQQNSQQQQQDKFFSDTKESLSLGGGGPGQQPQSQPQPYGDISDLTLNTPPVSLTRFGTTTTTTTTTPASHQETPRTRNTTVVNATTNSNHKNSSAMMNGGGGGGPPPASAALVKEASREIKWRPMEDEERQVNEGARTRDEQQQQQQQQDKDPVMALLLEKGRASSNKELNVNLNSSHNSFQTSASSGIDFSSAAEHNQRLQACFVSSRVFTHNNNNNNNTAVMAPPNSTATLYVNNSGSQRNLPRNQQQQQRQQQQQQQEAEGNASFANESWVSGDGLDSTNFNVEGASGALNPPMVVHAIQWHPLVEEEVHWFPMEQDHHGTTSRAATAQQREITLDEEENDNDVDDDDEHDEIEEHHKEMKSGGSKEQKTPSRAAAVGQEKQADGNSQQRPTTPARTKSLSSSSSAEESLVLVPAPPPPGATTTTPTKDAAATVSKRIRQQQQQQQEKEREEQMLNSQQVVSTRMAGITSCFVSQRTITVTEPSPTVRSKHIAASPPSQPQQQQAQQQTQRLEPMERQGRAEKQDSNVMPSQARTHTPKSPTPQQRQQQQQQPPNRSSPAHPSQPVLQPQVEKNSRLGPNNAPPVTTAATQQSQPQQGESEFGQHERQSPANKGGLHASVMSTDTYTSHGHVRTGNIFAEPVKVPKDFKPPVFPKEVQERQFLQKVLSKHFIFGRMNAGQVYPLIMAFERAIYKPGQKIIRQGEVGDYFFIVYEGTCRFEVNGKIVVRPTDGKKQTAGKGDAFGDLSLLYTSLRAATVRAETVTTVFRVDQLTFRKLIQTQITQTDYEKKMLLRGIPFLQDLDDDAIEKLAYALMPRAFEKDEYIVRKGDTSDDFFVIQEGEARVKDITVGGVSKYEDYTMKPGDYFGERAMMLNEPREANIVALTNGMAFTIDKKAFERVFGNLSNMNIRGQDKRILNGIKIIKDTHLTSAEVAMMANLVVDCSFRKGDKIIMEHERVEAALYLVRGGKVRITSSDGQYDTMVAEGGYFGEENLLLDTRNSNTSANEALNQRRAATASVISLPSTMMSNYTVEVLEDCVCGVLTLKELRTIFDTRCVGMGKRTRFQSVLEHNIKLNEIKKRRLLGQGTFGQVWLATRGNDDSTPYALKIQSKYELLEHNQVEGVIRERKIMGILHHPFTMKLVKTYQDSYFLYMLLEFVQGGELLSRYAATRYQGLPELDSLFYSACIFDALFHMHRRMIVYRDLKPENVLIDSEGYVVIADFGFAKIVEGKTHTFCGSPMYMAPEVICSKGHGKAADIWSLGVMIYEMLTGDTPFYREGMDKSLLFQNICDGKIVCPTNKIPPDPYDLIMEMLRPDPNQRIGSLAEGEKDIANHRWFENGGIVWDQLRRKELPAPWLPDVGDTLDVSNFGDWDGAKDKTTKKKKISPRDERLFAEF